MGVEVACEAQFEDGDILDVSVTENESLRIVFLVEGIIGEQLLGQKVTVRRKNGTPLGSFSITETDFDLAARRTTITCERMPAPR